MASSAPLLFFTALSMKQSTPKYSLFIQYLFGEIIIIITIIAIIIIIIIIIIIVIIIITITTCAF